MRAKSRTRRPTRAWIALLAASVAAFAARAEPRASAASATSPGPAAGHDSRGATPEGELPFVHVGTDLGLGELGAWQIAQDSAGYLWIAGETGVFRYDGRHVLRFGTAEGLPAPYVTQIAVGHGDVVWCVTSAGVARYRRGVWDAMWNVAPGLGLDAVRHIAVDARGTFWATTSRGVVREGDDGALAVDASWPAEDVDALSFDPSGAALVGTRGAVHVREADGTSHVLADGLPAERLTGAARDALGRVWAIATSGVYLLGRGASRFERWQDFPPVDAVVVLDPSGRPWFASERGLFFAGDDDAKHRAAGLSNDFLGGAFFDREGSLWALGFGMFRLAGRGLWRAHFDRDGLPSNIVWSVHPVGGELWVGTSAGVARATAAGWVTIDAIPKETIRSIVPTPSGVWLSGPVGKVFRYDPGRGALDTYDVARGVPDARTLAVAIDGGGAAWVGTAEAGVVRSVGQGADLHFEPVPLAAPGATVRDLLRDRRGRMWIASNQGLFLSEGGPLRRYTTADGLRSDDVSYLLERRSGELCVAYRLTSGVDCFRADAGSLSPVMQLDERTGLSSNVVYLVGEDASGRLWIGTNSGVDLWDGRQMAHFGTLDGLPSFDCDARAFAASADGDVWIGTSRGLGQFLGASYAGPPPPPPVAIEATHENAAGASWPLVDGARIAFGDGAVTVQYAALSYLHEPAMAYETRMLGAGGAWQQSTSDHTRYDAMSPGSYEFQVRARHPGGAWGAPASVRFVVTPPWWQTAWFRALAVCGAAAALFAFVRWRSAALARRNRELEAVVDLRTRDLAKAQAEIARAEKLSAMGRMLAQLSHELNNPINVVRNNIGPLREYVAAMGSTLAAFREQSQALPDGGAALAKRWKDAELDFIVADSSEALAVIERAAQRVSTMQVDLATFLRGDAATKSAGDPNHDLRETLEMVRHGLASEVTIEERYGVLPSVVYDANRINQVFLNLLQNAVQAVGNHGTITVRTWGEAGWAYVEIADDGPGVPPALRDHIFEPFFTTKPVGQGTGLGLSICRQIVVEQHGGTLRLDEARARGASFVVGLPPVG